MINLSSFFCRQAYALFFLFFIAVFPPQLLADQKQGTIPIEKQHQVRLQLKWKHQFQFAGYYAALEKGFYQDAGLQVEIVELEEGQESIDQVIAGHADFGIAMSDLISKRAAGFPVVALAAIYQHSPLVLLAPHSSKIDHIHDIIGKKVALEAHSEELLAYFNTESVTAGDLIIYPHQFSIKNLLEGKVDAISAYSTDEPFLLLRDNIPYSTFSPRAGGIDFYGDTLFTSEKMIEKHPERVEAFLDGSLRGWEYALNNSDEIIELILRKYSKRHSRKHLEFEAEKSKRLIMAEVIELGYMNPGRWEHIARTLQSLNKIPSDFTIDGFLYSRRQDQVSSWVYLGFGAAIIFSILAFFITARFHKLNLSLKGEMLERAKVEEDLRDSERKLFTLMSNLPGMAYRCLNDKQFTMQFVSMGCKALTGYSSEELVNNATIAFSDLIHDDDRDDVVDQVNSAINDCRPFKIIYRLIDKDNNFKWVWEQGRGIYSSGGDFLFLEGFIIDISKQRRVELEREQLVTELQTALDEVKQLSGLLPLCSHCKKVRDDKGYWSQIDAYLVAHSDADISHSICPDCADKYYEEYDLFDKNVEKTTTKP